MIINWLLNKMQEEIPWIMDRKGHGQKKDASLKLSLWQLRTDEGKHE